MKILIIDPDPRTGQRLLRVLKEDYIVDFAMNAKDAEELLYTSHYDLMITDLNLPDINGEDFVNLIRTNIKELPIMVLSGKMAVSDRDFAFEKGADDYMIKPLNTIELKARIKALLNRKPNREKSLKEILELRDLVLDRAKRMSFYKNERLRLRKKEMQLLEYLLENQGRVVTRGEILERVWDSSANPFTNTVEVHLKRLRDKIEKPYNEKFIETVHGFGYMMS